MAKAPGLTVRAPPAVINPNFFFSKTSLLFERLCWNTEKSAGLPPEWSRYWRRDQAKAGNQELALGPPHACMDPSTWSIFCGFSRHISQELEWKGSSQDSKQYSYGMLALPAGSCMCYWPWTPDCKDRKTKAQDIRDWQACALDKQDLAQNFCSDLSSLFFSLFHILENSRISPAPRVFVPSVPQGFLAFSKWQVLSDPVGFSSRGTSSGLRVLFHWVLTPLSHMLKLLLMSVICARFPNFQCLKIPLTQYPSALWL